MEALNWEREEHLRWDTEHRRAGYVRGPSRIHYSVRQYFFLSNNLESLDT
jgi:hypothetical protein